jgi:diazepam-binding inhibitor (GABA receptor modulating acyl-CoA-binding protein)
MSKLTETKTAMTFDFACSLATKMQVVRDEDKLEIYALYKQATHGPNNTSKPWAVDLKNRAKWSSWTNLGSMSKDSAKRAYVSKVEGMRQ